MDNLRRPIPPCPFQIFQLGILVLDGSVSMGDPDVKGRGTKAEAVGKAVKGLIRSLALSSRSRDFYLSLIVFGDRVEEPLRLLPTPLHEIDLETLNTNPYLGDQTAVIEDAIEKAGNIAEEFLKQDAESFIRQYYVEIILMSAAKNIRGENAIVVSKSFKEKIKRGRIHCVFYGNETDPNYETLKEISSGPYCFTTNDDGSSLRRLFFREELDEIIRLD